MYKVTVRVGAGWDTTARHDIIPAGLSLLKLHAVSQCAETLR